MSKKLVSMLGAAILALSVAALTTGQEVKTTTTTTVQKAVQNPDGTWTVVEYPIGKEVVVDLTPAATLKGATGHATILRSPDGTTVKVNLTGIPADMTVLNLYAVDPTGTTTLLGPLAIENGVGTFATTNPLPLNKFMIIASPEASLATFTPEAPVIFRSAVPTGLAVVPLVKTEDNKIVATGEKVAVVVPVVKAEDTKIVTTVEKVAVVAPVVKAEDTKVVTTVEKVTAVVPVVKAENTKVVTTVEKVAVVTPVVKAEDVKIVPVEKVTVVTPVVKAEEVKIVAVEKVTAVVPVVKAEDVKIIATGEKVAAVTSPYAIPMIGIPTLPAKKETEVHINFAESYHAQRATIFITPNFNDSGATRVKAKFHELSGVPDGAFLTLWAVGPDGTFTRLGSTSNSGKPNVATIDTDTNKTNVALADFGLFLTTEPSDALTAPSGPVILRIIK
jgi:hypothetical protein